MKNFLIILSKEEIKNIIDVIKNPKHKLIISLAYRAELRISEVINLKVKKYQFRKINCSS
jgi:integrase